MGKGGYLGGSTIIRAWGGHASKSKTQVGAINLNAHLDKPTQPKSVRKRKVKGTQQKADVSSAKPQKTTAKAHKPAPAAPRKGNGLTIPEMIGKARKRVEAVEADLAKARRRVAEFDRQLLAAKKQLAEAENLSRRSALGHALAKATEAPKQP